MERKLISLATVLVSLNVTSAFAKAAEGEGCIVSLETGEKYCLKVGERSGYSLPAFIYQHDVDVYAAPGTAVMLSDWDNLSYNRLAVFQGFTPNQELESVTAYNGKIIDFSAPRSMRVVAKDAEVEPELTWSWQESDFMPQYNQVMSSPVIVQLNDDNGDGKINNRDIADIIVTTFSGSNYSQNGIVRALSGKDGAELWDYREGPIFADPRYSVAAADLDGDGKIEIVSGAIDSNYITILDHQGHQKKQIEIISTGYPAGQFAIADIDNDGSAEILGADGVYNYQTGLLKFSYAWSPAPIPVDADGDGIQEVFADTSLYDANGAEVWSYPTPYRAWFSSVANLDDDASPELIVSIPRTASEPDRSSFSVLEHDGSVKWSVTNVSNPGGGVQAVSNFLGKPNTSAISQSDTFGFKHRKSAKLAVEDEQLLYVNSGLAIDAIGTNEGNLVGGDGGHVNAPIDLTQVTEVAITSGKYFWGGKHLLALEFYYADGSSTMFGSKRAAFWQKTEHFQLPKGKTISAVNVWSKGWLVEALQFELSEAAGNETLGIVYAGYNAVDMYNRHGELVWTVPNDDSTSGKIGVSAFDFTGNGIDEVLVQDQFKVRILDGRSGLALAEIANSTGSLWEFPVVADLAGDNDAELVIVANDYDERYSTNHGVYVYNSDDDDKPWKNATRIWNQHAFYLSNINQDGTLPDKYEPSWLTHNTYRSSSYIAEESESSKIYGFPTGQATELDLDDELFVRSSWMIDALGADEDEMVGGHGGVLGIPVDLERVASVEVTYGTFYWGGDHVVALTFIYHDGTVLFYGSKHYAYAKKTGKFDVPEGKEIEDMNVWATGNYVDAVQFIFD
ncbi:FG-GAP-like repeat-containing protein [Vibrio tubiashii]|uniref:beta-prism lectin domain-containing protein n=1 Tax=Vibrio tubiashii TaxID=29498 RepID=UPI001EFC90F5|nr:beta-prism lectin domain-containing protein [Vibrio tubiashii]MCG9581930.1 FG-GAP-like repeat-containing protein [Vibrio tubiashii]MCG9615521.1 FG-GAP-like repeat-containing protein [Vibrio tubiashii]MCG9689457.1 FG-GAP-like repeat-containing protein [Vibrio tubiashii]